MVFENGPRNDVTTFFPDTNEEIALYSNVSHQIKLGELKAVTTLRTPGYRGQAAVSRHF
jgi:hypothetical protein